MDRKCSAFFLLLVLLLGCGESGDSFVYIAHAGGGLEGKEYNNNLQSVRNSYLNGFKLIEIDFLVTSDGYVVCGYTWAKEGWDHPPVEKEFVSKMKAQRCTANSLVDWLKSNEGVQVVIDAKDSPVYVWDYIAQNFPDLLSRFIPQAYRVSDVSMLLDMGYSDVFLTLYKYKEKEIDDLLASLQSCDATIGALVLNFENKILTSSLSSSLRRCGVKLYVYTVNNPVVVEKLIQEKRIDGVYTDHILPIRY